MQSIILSRRDFRENDQMISVFTKERGKMEFLARGVKKSISKNSAHLEPFSVVFVEWVPGKQVHHLTSVVPYAYHPRLRSDFLGSMAASTVMSIVDAVTQVDVPDVPLYTILSTWLKYLEETLHTTMTMTDAVILKIFAALGVPPVLDRCVVCAKPWDAIGKELLDARTSPFSIGFSPGAGGLLCHSCAEQKKPIDADVFFCGLTDMSALQLLLNDTWRVIDAFPLEPKDRSELHTLVLEYARYHSERSIGDWQKWWM